MKYEVMTQNGKATKDGEIINEKGIGICKDGLEWVATDLYSGAAIGGGTNKEKCLENVDSVFDKIEKMRETIPYLQKVLEFNGTMEGVMA